MIRHYCRFAGYLLPFFIVYAGVVLLGAQAKPSGADPYTPTKQEWLINEFNQLWRGHDHGKDGDYVIRSLYVMATKGANANEVVIKYHSPDKPPGYRNERAREIEERENLDLAGKRLKEIAASYGWQDWLVVRELVIKQVWPEN